MSANGVTGRSYPSTLTMARSFLSSWDNTQQSAPNHTELWGGTFRDRNACDRVYVANHEDGTVSVIDGASNAIIATVPVGGGASGVGVNHSTSRVYVANLDDGTISVIDDASNAVIATVPVGHQPWFVEVNSTTGRVYVTNAGTVSGYGANRNDGTISVIDGASNAVIATIRVGAQPRGARGEPQHRPRLCRQPK